MLGGKAVGNRGLEKGGNKCIKFIPGWEMVLGLN